MLQFFRNKFMLGDGLMKTNNSNASPYKKKLVWNEIVKIYEKGESFKTRDKLVPNLVHNGEDSITIGTLDGTLHKLLEDGYLTNKSTKEGNQAKEWQRIK